MKKRELAQFLRPFTDEIDIVIQDRHGDLLSTYAVRYEIINGYGTVILVEDMPLNKEIEK